MNTFNTLKHILKRKISITEALLVSFLITGSVGYALDINENFINEEILESENPIKINGNNLSIKNIGTISATDVAGIESSSKKLLSIENLGIIKANSSNRGRGIFLLDTYIDKIVNTGLITGNSLSDRIAYVGDGINLYSNNNINLSVIENSGVISGRAPNALVSAGTGLFIGTQSNLNLTELNNTGFILGRGGKLSDGIRLDGLSNGSIRVGTISNIGKILGGDDFSNGNGIVLDVSSIGDIEVKNIKNTGIISGISKVVTTERIDGNGIVGDKPFSATIFENIENTGIISGYNKNLAISTSGNGIMIPFGNNERILNKGIIRGTGYPIVPLNSSKIINSGILAGSKISDTNLFNKGIKIYLDSTNFNVNKIESGDAGSIDGKTIINGTLYKSDGTETTISTEAKDSYVVATDRTTYDNNIINGAGIEKGALQVTGTVNVNNSYVNGYNSAVYLGADSNLIAKDTVFNGGGLEGTRAVITGDNSDNKIEVLGKSIINGKISLDDGNDTLLVDNNIQLNGAIDGGLGKDTLNLGTRKNISNLIIRDDISGMENININGNVTLFESAKVNDFEKMTLQSGELTLKIDPTVKDSDGKIIGHSLYANKAILSTDGGLLNIGLNGLGENAIVSLGGVKLQAIEEEYRWIKTNSLLLGGEITANGNEVIIKLAEDLLPLLPPPIDPEPPVEPENPEPPMNGLSIDLYRKLNSVYKSIVSAKEASSLGNTTLLDDKTYNESLSGLLSLLDQIHSNNPYAYTFKSTRDSLKLFEDNLSYYTIKPKENEWLVQGKGIFTGIKADNKTSGKGHYGFDRGTRNYKTTTSTEGGLATFEYGKDETTSVGIVFGGNTQKVNFKGSSEIEGNSMYIGTFMKKDLNKFKLMGGLGYQYTSSDITRGVSNSYDSFKTNSKYILNSLNAFAEGKYVFNLNNEAKLEPKVRLSYYLINQEEVNEGYKAGQLSMGVDQLENNSLDVELGVDFTNKNYSKLGVINNILSVGLISTVGDRDNSLDGYILGKNQNGSKFKIEGAEIPELTGKLGYNLELEQENGLIYSAGIDFEFAKDYNRNISGNIGIGYKF